MLERRQFKKALVEYLVFVVIYCDILRVIVRGREEAVPCVWCFESIVQDDGCVGHFSNLAVSVTVELLGDVQAQLGHIEGWLVQELNPNDNILVLCLRVLLRNSLEYLQGLLHGIALLPLRLVRSLSRIVVSILVVALVNLKRH
jgi:hypothetical protein